MTARRELMIAEVLARLQTVPNVAIVLREPNAQPSTMPALTLDDRGQQVLETGAIHNLFAMSLVIGGYVAGIGTVPAATLNALYADVVRAIFGDGAQLGGLAELVTEADLQRDIAATDQKFTTLFELVITIQFRARTTDPALL